MKLVNAVKIVGAPDEASQATQGLLAHAFESRVNEIISEINDICDRREKEAAKRGAGFAAAEEAAQMFAISIVAKTVLEQSPDLQKAVDNSFAMAFDSKEEFERFRAAPGSSRKA